MDQAGIYASLAALAKKHGARRLVLFGSRARGSCQPFSDIDLAVYGMPGPNRARFWAEAEELPTLLKLDVVHIEEGLSPAFLDNIKKDGIDLMNSLSEKRGQLKAAVARLRQALDDYQNAPLDSVRDGAIQRFEFCTELSWKAMREYLLDQGFCELNSPKAVIRQAFACGMIADDAAWISLLNDRNLTSHVYDEKTAQDIFARIQTRYLALFDSILAYMG